MKVRVVTEPTDPALSPFVALRDRKRSETVVVEGEIAVSRALKSPWRVTTVAGTACHLARLSADLVDVPNVLQVDAGVLAEVTGFRFHRGCLAAMPRPALPSRPPPSWSSHMAERDRSITVVAERLADPANVGSVVRCCRALGADLLVLDAHGADPFSARAIRAAAGHVFTQPLVLAPSVVQVVDEIRRHLRARVLAASVDPDAVPIDEVERPRHVVLLLGTEAEGLSLPLRAIADTAVTIPMAHGVDSLNVAAAAAILLWALGRR